MREGIDHGAESRRVRGVDSFCVESAGEATQVTATLQACPLLGCETVASSECELTLEGAVVAVSGQAVVEREPGAGCTDACEQVKAVCQIDLAAGTYDLDAGDATLTVDVPVADRLCSE